MKRSIIALVVASALLAVIGGCEQGSSKIAGPEIPSVPVSHPVRRIVIDYVDYTGRTNAKEAVTIQARVTGHLIKMPFREGADVKIGDLLFEIDPRPYEAQLEAAQATVVLNEASVRYAVATNARFKEAAEKFPAAVSLKELDQYQALEEQAVANLKLAKANLDSAKLNLEWTKVTSPINGRISRYFLTIGNLVNQDVTPLTTLVSMDPMYAYFDMDEPTYQRVNRAISEGTIVPVKSSAVPRPQAVASMTALMSTHRSLGPLLAVSAFQFGSAFPDVPVQLELQGEENYPHRGAVNFIDNQVNPATGSVAVRGQFANPPTEYGNRLLIPGMFVRIRLPIGDRYQALLVIDRAITSDQGRKFVYVINKDNAVVERPVVTGALQSDGMRVIREGLNADDWVVIGALQQVKKNTKVRPEQMSMPTLDVPAKLAPPPTGKGKS